MLRALVLGVVWLGATLGVNLGGVAAAADTAPQEPRERAFSHREHVPSVWFEGDAETWRDCRGCHRFSATQAVSTPQRECAPCHGQGQLAVKASKGFENDLAGHRTRTRDAFRHHTHGMLECRQCHLPKDAEFGAENLRIVTGPGSCAPCHEAGRVDAGTVGTFRWFAADLEKAEVAAELGVSVFTRPTDAAAYATTLTTVFAGPTGGLNTTPLPTGGDFHHGDHLAIACADCHTNIQGASAVEVGTGAIPVAACKQCHVRDAAGKGAAAAAQGGKKVRALAALGTFAHRDHYGWQAGSKPGTKKTGVCSASAYEAIEKGCTACHTYVPVPGGLAERDFPFGSERSKETYLGCQTCHAVPGWSTGETKQAPLHGSSGAADGQGWRACTACHVFGGGDLAHQRPMAEVQRWSGRTFVFPANTHPDITSRGVTEAQRDGRAPLADCRECHRARVPELATRLEQKTFRHDVHLPANATAATCLGCHPSSAVATDGPSLAPGDFRTYTLASCQKCHWGGNVTEVAAPAPQPASKQVVAFPHGPHVTAAKQACTECHVLGKDGVDVGTKPEALACTQCHDHKEGGSRAERLFGDEVQSCAKCHRDAPTGPAPAHAIAAVPPVRGSAAAVADARYQAPQDVFAGFADAQFHPLGTKCSECHKDEAMAAVELPITDHLLGTQKPRFHAAGPKQPADCLRCHWKPVGEWAAAVNGSMAAPADKKLRAQPESREVRKAFGNSAVGYPGTERAKG